jgi:hypothetical protein
MALLQTKYVKLACALLLVMITAACRQDMHNAPFYIPLRESKFFADGRSSRDPVKGTVARGFLREDKYFYSGKIDGKPADVMPMVVTKELLQRGQERFNIYCSPCHSRTGDGNGMIVQRGYRKAATLIDDRATKLPVGHFYDVISNGFGVMPDYSSQVKPEDRWAIAAYVRVLQKQAGLPVRTAQDQPLPPGLPAALTNPAQGGQPNAAQGGTQGSNPTGQVLPGRTGNKPNAGREVKQ